MVPTATVLLDDLRLLKVQSPRLQNEHQNGKALLL